MSEKPSFKAVLSSRGFKFLWINQVLVQLAYNSLNFALIIWVFKLVGTSLAVSALILAIYLPSILFGMFAGVFVDILDRRKIILLIDALLAVLFFSFIFVKGSFPLILIDTFLINSLAQFFMPSESSSIPMLISKKQLFFANSLFSLTLYGAFMIGFSVSGPVLNIWGINSVFIIGMIMLLVAFVLAHNLPPIKVSRPGKKYQDLLTISGAGRLFRIAKEETQETVHFIKQKLEIMVSIGLLSVVQGIIGILAVLIPSYLERVLKIHATDSSYFVMFPLGLGMVFGALLSGRILHQFPRRKVVIPAVLGAGIIFLMAGVVPILAHLSEIIEIGDYIPHPRYFFRAPSLSSLFAVAAFLLGFCTVQIIISCQTVLQENTTGRNRGKIFAVLAVLMTGFSAVPVFLAGAVSDIFGASSVFFVIGVITLLLGLVASRPHLFFRENHLPFKIREFLGLGHWGDINRRVFK